MRYISTTSVLEPEAPAPIQVSDADYRTLAAFRASLRKFQRKSEAIVHAESFAPQQHQALLTIKGFSGRTAPTITDLATRLQVRHNSAVGLINRLETHGYVQRGASVLDRRRVHVTLTRKGEAVLDRLTLAHRVELRQIGPEITRLLAEVTR